MSGHCLEQVDCVEPRPLGGLGNARPLGRWGKLCYLHTLMLAGPVTESASQYKTLPWLSQVLDDRYILESPLSGSLRKLKKKHPTFCILQVS